MLSDDFMKSPRSLSSFNKRCADFQSGLSLWSSERLHSETKICEQSGRLLTHSYDTRVVSAWNSLCESLLWQKSFVVSTQLRNPNEIHTGESALLGIVMSSMLEVQALKLKRHSEAPRNGDSASKVHFMKFIIWTTETRLIDCCWVLLSE